MLAIVDKQPKTLGLIDIMKYFISHRQDVIRRRTRFDLKKAEARAHILEGLTIALDHLDAIIKLIRASKNVDEARAGLMERFKLTQIQAQAILEMQLQRLTHLERDKIVQEYEEVKALIAKLKKILSSDKLVQEIIVERAQGDQGALPATSAGPRSATRSSTDIRPEDLIKEEDVVVMTTQSGYIKRTSLSLLPFPDARRQGPQGHQHEGRGRRRGHLRLLDPLLPPLLHEQGPRLLAQGPRDPRRRRRRPGQGDRQPHRVPARARR